MTKRVGEKMEIGILNREAKMQGFLLPKNAGASSVYKAVGENVKPATSQGVNGLTNASTHRPSYSDRPFTLERAEYLRQYERSPKRRQYVNNRWKTYRQTAKRKAYLRNWRKTPIGRLSNKTHTMKHCLKTQDLTIEVVQQIYEANIKKYGTLTCYLCLRPILFGQDHLDHKIPVSRVVEFPEVNINSKKNLGVAHSHCNEVKNNKTVQEYKKFKAAERVGEISVCLDMKNRFPRSQRPTRPGLGCPLNRLEKPVGRCDRGFLLERSGP